MSLIKFSVVEDSQESFIYLSIKIKNQKYSIATPYSIKNITLWDYHKERPQNIYLKKNKELYNNLINLKLEITKHIISSKNSFSLDSIKNKIKELYEIKYNHHQDSLIFQIETYINKKTGFICNSTIKRYKVFLQLMKRFEGYVNKRILIRDINSSLIQDFLQFGKDEEYNESTLYKSISFIKTILRQSERKGIKTNIYEIEIPRKKPNQHIVTLSEKELHKIQNTKVPEKLKNTKDWLIISCYTGQRISDFMQFSNEDLKLIEGKLILEFVQKKTQKKVALPIHPIVRKIIAKNNNRFPEKIPSHLYNSKIKDIVRLAGIDELTKSKKRKGFRTHNVFCEKWKLITSHIGRRSFATNFYGKIPTPLLIQATGHATEQMFIEYIDPTNKEKVLSLSSYFDKEYKKLQSNKNYG